MWGEPGGDRILFAINIKATNGLYQKASLSSDNEAF
jgi:hypothetical protein